MQLSAIRPAALIGTAWLVAAFAAGMAPLLLDLHRIWTAVYDDLAHGYLVLGMAAVLAWNARESPRFRMGDPWWPALPLLVVAVLLATLFDARSVGSVSKGMLPPVIFLTLAATCGIRIALASFGAIALLYFGLPVWWPINGPLQHLTAAVANLFVDLTGMPAYVEGNVFHLPGGVVEVASGCSGLNYLLVGLTLAWYQGQLYLRDNRNRIRLLAVATVLSLVSNWVRVSALVWIGYVSNMQHYLIRVDHLYFGWGLYLLVIWPLVLYGLRLERLEQARELPQGGVLAPAPGSRRRLLFVVLAGVVLLLPAGWRLALPAAAAG